MQDKTPGRTPTVIYILVRAYRSKLPNPNILDRLVRYLTETWSELILTQSGDKRPNLKLNMSYWPAGEELTKGVCPIGGGLTGEGFSGGVLTGGGFRPLFFPFTNLSSYNVDVTAITEIHFKDNNSNNIVGTSGYNLCQRNPA